MSPTDVPRAPSRRPLALIGLLLVLLAGIAAVTAHFYWSSLRSGLVQMRASVAAAQAEQQRLLERLRAAQAAQARRADAADPTPARAGPAAAPATVPGAEAAAGPAPGTVAAGTPRAPMMSPPRVLPVAERARLVTWIEALARTAARLPAGPRRGGATVAKHLLREQLVVAAVAAEAGDVILLDAALFAGQRLLAEPYRSPDSGGAALAAQLQGVRERLRGHMAAAGYPPLERLGAIAGQASPR